MKLKTAKDLQGWHNTYPSNHPTRDLIERIDDKETALAEAQRELAALREENARLKAPVSESEFDEHFRSNSPTRDTATVPDVEALIAARAQKGNQPAKEPR